MSNDSAQRQAIGTHPETFSGRAHCRRPSRTQTGADAAHACGSAVDSQHRRAMAHAAAELSALQNGASALSDGCSNEARRCVPTDIANELRDKGALDEEERFIDAT